jgi:AraC-like DNA-binding protein
VHSLVSEGESLCWIGVFSEDFVHAFAKETLGKTGTDFVFRCAPPIEEFLRKNLLTAEIPPLFLLKSCLYAVCAEYNRQITLVPQEAKSGALMRAVTDYIGAQYKNSITLADMARALGYNYHYLSKCFHRIFNMPFPEFLNSYRLEAALALLTESERNIADIAFESGFGSVRSFNAYFKSRIGTAPAAYSSEKKEARISR